MTLDMENCVLGVYEFNRLAGNYDNITKEKLLAQAKVVLEEAKELLQAIENDEGEEQILKELCDCHVPITGISQMLILLGYGVFPAWKKVNANNLQKFCNTELEAIYSKEAYEAQGISVEINKIEEVFVLKDKNGKVRKPLNYEKVSVKEFTPEWKSVNKKGLV